MCVPVKTVIVLWLILVHFFLVQSRVVAFNENFTHTILKALDGCRGEVVGKILGGHESENLLGARIVVFAYKGRSMAVRHAVRY